MQSQSHWTSTGIRFFARVVTALLLAGTAATASAQINTITLTNSDAGGTSSFASGFGATNWNNGLAPFSGNGVFTNAYFTSTNSLRTPPGSGNYIFAGDSLEIDAGGGALGIKGSGTITVSNLNLNGGKVSNSGTGGSPDTALLAGNINVIASSVLDGGGTTGVTALNVLAPMTGSGSITIQDNGTVIFSTNSTYTGNTTVSTNSTLKMGAANAITNGPGNGFVTLSGGTPSGAVLDLNGYNTAVNDLTSGGGVFPAQIINSAPGTTNTLTVDCEFATGKTWKGYITDSNVLGGKLALTVIGSTFWTVASNLTYSGDTTINGGRVLMGASTVLPWGAGKGNIIVNSNGILDLQGRSPQLNGLAGNGMVDNFAGNGPGAGGHSTLNCGSNDVFSTFSGVIQNRYYYSAIPANDYIQISKFGAGTLTLSGTNTYNGNVTINAGVLRITYQNGDGVTGGGLGLGSQTTPPTKIINIASTLGDAGLHFLATNGSPIVVDSSLSFQTAGTNGAIVNEAGNNTINGSISLRTGGATTIRVDGDTLTLAGSINILTNVSSRTLTLSGATNGIVSGVISDGSSANNPNTNILSLTKAGTGTWTLTASNTYSDTTTVSSGGTLALSGAGSIANSATIALQSAATLDVSAATGGWALGAGQTLKGSGHVTGNATISGTLSPGSLSIGTLTFSTNLTLNGTSTTALKINRTNSPNSDLVSVAHALVCGGTLTVTNTGDPLQAGDTFTNFSAASSSGSFSTTNLPALSSPLFWDTSLLGSQGVIKVASTVVPQPHFTGISLSGTNLVITGTNGVNGGEYNILTSTNLALPLTNWTVLPTNTFNGATFSITNTVNTNAPQNFYILRVP